MDEPEGVPETGQTKYLDPFGGDSKVMTWSEPVNIGQLNAEFQAALPEVQLAVCPPQVDGVDVAVDAEHPLTVFLSPSSVDLTQARQVLASHRPDPYYGLTDEEIEAAQLLEKIHSEQQMTVPEIQAALRMLTAS